MAIAEDLDRATDSQWDWVAEHTRTYLARRAPASTTAADRWITKVHRAWHERSIYCG